jgi:hypothetical protein
MSSSKAGGKVTGIQFSPWNLLLLLPLWILITPLYNSRGPALFGMPFFYWSQFAAVVVGVVCTSIVYAKTKTKATVPPPPDGPPDVDELDEGSAR